MGISLTAKLYYGFPLLETMQDSDEYDEDKCDWYGDEGYRWEEDEIERQAPKPTDEDYESPAWQEWRRRRNEILLATPCTVEMAGYMDYTYYVLAIRSSYRSAYASDTAIVLPEFDPGWDEQLRVWCERVGFKYQTPSWHLAPLCW